jgi:hypothetical protein
MSDSTQVSIVSSNTQALYKRLGFYDKNRDGVIKKTSKWDILGFFDENYIETADLDGDGKIVEAEAKYYLQNMISIKPDVKQRFAYTGADLETLLETAWDIENSSNRAKVITDIVLNMGKVGLDKSKLSKIFQKTLRIARTIVDPQERMDAMECIFFRMTDAELYKDALGAFREIDDSYEENNAIMKILSWIEEDKMDKSVISKLFEELLDAVATMKDPYDKSYMSSKGPFCKSNAIFEITLTLSWGLVDKNETSRLFNKALDIARTLVDPFWEASVIRYIASGMAKVRLFKEALETARTIDGSYDGRADALGQIAMEMHWAELDKNRIINLFNESLEAARSIINPDSKASVIGDTASRIIRTDLDENEEIKLLKKALAVAGTIKDLERKDAANKYVAEEMSEAKLFKEALEAAKMIRDSQRRKWILGEIAYKMAKAGMGKNEISNMFKEAGLKLLK